MAFFDTLRTAGWNAPAFLGTSRRTRVASACALFLAACAFGAAGMAPLPDDEGITVQSIVQPLSQPAFDEQLSALRIVQHAYTQEETIRRGDSLASLLMRLGIDDDDAVAFIKSDATARKLLQLKAGKVVQARTDGNGTLLQLSMLLSEGNRDQPAQNLVIRRNGDAFTASEMTATLEKRLEMRSGEIRSSLFAATDQAQIPDSVATQIVDMFSTNIDFRSDLRRGDRFNIVYETFWQNGEYVQSGRVIAGEFVNDGTSHQAVWFADSGDGKGGFYSMDGKSLKKAFLKSPLEFSRISSGFSMRIHPLSGKWKAHKGVDFAAATGTPIRAAADGTVDFIGVQGGYGNLVVLKHWNGYSTAYAHMSRFGTGMRRGAKVAQGEVIGYVGSTGWSTGPHLHYEFRVNNEPRDPMAIDLPNARPLSGTELARFRSVASDMAHRFALLRSGDQRTAVAAR